MHDPQEKAVKNDTKAYAFQSDLVSIREKFIFPGNHKNTILLIIKWGKHIESLATLALYEHLS